MAFLLLLLFGLANSVLAAEPQSAVVIVPVADVWSRPLSTEEKPADSLRETQVLFGEKLLIHKSSGTWMLIEAVEQPEFTHHNRWEGYPGWVRATQILISPVSVLPSVYVTERWAPVRSILPGLNLGRLPLGSQLIFNTKSENADKRIGLTVPGYTKGWVEFGKTSAAGLPSESQTAEKIAQRVLDVPQEFMGIPYLWGGLSPDGVDCSGLVHLSYRISAINLPRDSHEQWMKAKPIKRAELKPADLIFSAKADNPKKITHVALYAGDGQIIEAPQTGMVVRKISFKEKYGKDFEKVESGDKIGDRVVYFGSFLQK